MDNVIKLRISLQTASASDVSAMSVAVDRVTHSHCAN